MNNFGEVRLCVPIPSGLFKVCVILYNHLHDFTLTLWNRALAIFFGQTDFFFQNYVFYSRGFDLCAFPLANHLSGGASANFGHQVQTPHPRGR